MLPENPITTLMFIYGQILICRDNNERYFDETINYTKVSFEQKCVRVQNVIMCLYTAYTRIIVIYF